MAREIERKFLVASPPAAEAGAERGAAVAGRSGLRQGYLAIDGPVEVRVRDEDGSATLTVKAGRGVERAEVEVPLDAGDLAALWPFAAPRSLEKTRTRVRLDGGLVAELDEYEGALAGLRVVEVEFPDRASADAFVAPAWFGREVTGEPGWTNAELATKGRPAGS